MALYTTCGKSHGAWSFYIEHTQIQVMAFLDDRWHSKAILGTINSLYTSAYLVIGVMPFNLCSRYFINDIDCADFAYYAESLFGRQW